MDNTMTTLYQIDNKKALRTWTIWSEDFTIIIEHGIHRGKQQRVEEPIMRGLGSRTIDEQIESRMNSRISKQLAKGYKRTVREAELSIGQNELNLFKPMLAQQFNKQKSVDTEGAVLQRKLDGNRMLVTMQNGVVSAYTRNGKLIKTLDHILEQIDWLTEGQTIDGEVYKHGMALKDIRGAVAKKQANTAKLDYHIYDCINDESFKERFTFIDKTYSDNIIVEPYWDVQGEEHTAALFNRVRQDGYEGLMMRLDGYGYQAGKRAKGLLKIKYRYDAEYEVIDIEIAKNGAGILVMRLPNGKTVKGTAPGTAVEKLLVANQPDNYIGKLCTCSFAYLTEFGIPFHLTCDNWRT